MISSHSSQAKSEKEYRGMKFGLSRAQFQNAPNPVKFLIGIEVEVADYVGYQLVNNLVDVNDENVKEIHTSYSSAQILIKGKGTRDIESQHEPLHFYIIAPVRYVIV